MRKLTVVLVALFTCINVQAQPKAFSSTYETTSGQSVLFKNASIQAGDGPRLNDTDLYITAGKIAWIGEGDQDRTH